MSREASVPELQSGNGGAERHDLELLERQGWSSRAAECAPKISALAALAALPLGEPVPTVSYESQGNVLVIAGEAADAARAAAEALAGQLHVTLLCARPIAARGAIACWTGRIDSLQGYLGAFDASIAGLSPGKGPVADRVARFDLVLDFSARPLFASRQPPQGYFRAPDDANALELVLEELREAVGAFEKPRYFSYRESICAHQRSEIVGCNACIEICSTQAISPDGDHVKVDPHLCMGCGACSTVCPSGAMSYQFPRVADRGAQLKQLLSVYRGAGGRDPCIVFHDGRAGRDLLAAAASSGAGLPANALPVETWHVASVGLDLLLPAVAFGAARAVVLASTEEDPEYRAALKDQVALGQAILEGLGHAGTRLHVLEAGDVPALASAFAALPPVSAIGTPATFVVSDDKRTAIEFAVEHFARFSPRPVDEIALPEGAPFGEVRVDAAKCTMCMACVGSCPESALMDGVDQPLLKFLERNCVRCGLCEATCPEAAITLHPRLLLTPAAREARTLNETQPFHCVSCGKAFGTRQMVDVMLGRLAGHSMFSRPGALRRLQMCSDCRVVDMMSTKDEVSVLTLGDPSR